MTGVDRDQPLGMSGRLALVGILVAGTIMAAANPLNVLFFETYSLVGAYLVFRRPRNVIGWLLLGIAFGFIATSPPPDVDAAALIGGHATPRDTVTTWIAGWSGWATYVALLALTIVVPSGRLPQAKGRGMAIILLAVGVADVVLSAVAPTISLNADGVTTIPIPNPVAVLPDLPLWSAIPIQDAIFPTLIAVLVIGAVRMVLRYRASKGVERLQLRWLGAAVTLVCVGLLTGLVLLAVFGDGIGVAAWTPAIIAYPAIPLAIGIAVMRYRLFEIDRIISRTIGWTIVTGTLVAVFGGAVVALQGPLARFTQGQTLAVATSTLAALALFQPVRRRVQALVDRRFDRARFDGERTATAFAQRLRDETDMDTVLGDVARTTSSTVAPTSLTIWLRPRRVGG